MLEWAAGCFAAPAAWLRKNGGGIGRTARFCRREDMERWPSRRPWLPAWMLVSELRTLGAGAWNGGRHRVMVSMPAQELPLIFSSILKRVAHRACGENAVRTSEQPWSEGVALHRASFAGAAAPTNAPSELLLSGISYGSHPRSLSRTLPEEELAQQLVRRRTTMQRACTKTGQGCGVSCGQSSI